jgi:hypothetical protein
MSGAAASKHEIEDALRRFGRRLVPKLGSISSIGQQDRWQFGYLDLILTACEIGLKLAVDGAVIDRVLKLIVDFDAPLGVQVYHADAAVAGLFLRAWFIAHRSN